MPAQVTRCLHGARIRKRPREKLYIHDTLLTNGRLTTCGVYGERREARARPTWTLHACLAFSLSRPHFAVLTSPLRLSPCATVRCAADDSDSSMCTASDALAGRLTRSLIGGKRKRGMLTSGGCIMAYLERFSRPIRVLFFDSTNIQTVT